MNPQPYTPEHLAALREQILARYNDQELRTLCADLGVDYDETTSSPWAVKTKPAPRRLYRRRIHAVSTALLQQ